MIDNEMQKSTLYQNLRRAARESQDECADNRGLQTFSLVKGVGGVDAQDLAKGTTSPDNKKPYFKKQSTIDYAKGIKPLKTEDRKMNKHFSNLILKSKLDSERHKEKEMRIFR